MKLKILKYGKIISFIGGAAAVICGKKIIKSQKTHDICVSGVAKSMQLYKKAKETAMNIKEEAEDICEEAKDSIEKEDE